MIKLISFERLESGQNKYTVKVQTPQGTFTSTKTITSRYLDLFWVADSIIITPQGEILPAEGGAQITFGIDD